MYPQCSKAAESLQHAVVHVLQPVGSEDQLIDPRSSFKRSLLDVSDAVITQVAASGGKNKERGEMEGMGGGGAAQQSGLVKPPQQHLFFLQDSQ